MKNIKICTPVIGKTLKEFLKNLEKVQEVSDMVELRVDKIKDLREQDLKLIRKKTIKEAILTSRRKDILLKGLDLKFDFIDIDLSMINDLRLSQLKQSKIILSFHDFQKTPNIKKLVVILDQMRKCRSDIIKIATKVKNNEDLGNLFRLILAKKKEEKIIVVGMGKKGQLTRILGPLLGSFLAFASTEFGMTAPGQIDINKMRNIYKLLT